MEGANDEPALTETNSETVLAEDEAQEAGGDRRRHAARLFLGVEDELVDDGVPGGSQTKPT